MSTEEAQGLARDAVLAQIDEGVIVADVVGTITFINEAAARIHGVKRLNVKPSAYSEIYHLFREDGRPYPSHELPLARAVRGETVIDARWHIRRADGAQVSAVGTAQPVYGPDGRRIGAILTMRDVTEIDALRRTVRETKTALENAERRLAAQSG